VLASKQLQESNFDVSRKGVKTIVWLAAVISVSMMFATASPAFDRYESLALFLGACVLLIAAVLWNMRVMPGIEAREEQARMRRIAELKQQVMLSGQPVEFRTLRRSALFMLLLLACLVLASVHRALVKLDGEALAMIAVSVPVFAFVLWWSWPWIFRPALIVRRDGIEAAPYGLFRWEEIESIGIRSHPAQGFVSHSLHLYVPTLRAREKQLGFLAAARRGMTRGAEPNFVVIPLGLDSQRQVIHALCFELWKERTGRTSVATTAPGVELLALQRWADEQLAAIERIASTAETDPERAVRMLDEAKKRFPVEAASPQPKPRTVAQTRKERMMTELRAIDRRDTAAYMRIIDKYAKEDLRRRDAIVLIVIIVAAALTVSAAVLLNG